MRQTIGLFIVWSCRWGGGGTDHGGIIHLLYFSCTGYLHDVNLYDCKYYIARLYTV